MKAKKSVWSFGIFAIMAFALVFGLGFKNQGANVFAQTDEHITFNVTVDDAEAKVVDLPYAELLEVKYTVAENTGVDALQLALSYDTDAFTLDHVVTLNTTALGAATVNGANIVFENADVNGAAYNTTGDDLIVAYFAVNATATTSAAYEFGIVDANDGNDFSNAWRIEKNLNESATHTPVTINFNSPIVYIRGELAFTLTGNTKTYDGEAALDSEITVNTSCENLPTINRVWFVANGNNTYTKLDTNPVDVGTYYVVAQFAENEYYDAYCGYSGNANDGYTLDSEEGKIAQYTITTVSIKVLINDKTSIYGEAIVPLTYQITEGTVCAGDNLNITLSTTATSSSNVGTYPITGIFDNSNYSVVFTDGTYTITKKAITITALDQSAKYTGFEPEVDQTKYTVAGVDSISGVVITKEAGVTVGTYALIPSLDNNNYNATCVNGTFTITLSDLTQEQVDNLVAQFAKFYAVDNGSSTELTITNQEGSYSKTYDANSAYIGVVVENNEKIAQLVQYKIGDSSYTEVQAVLNNFATYAKKNAGTYLVKITFTPGDGYAFATGVDAEYEITLNIARKSLTITASSDVQYGDEEVITVDNGTNAWVEGESYTTYSTNAEALKAYVNSTYNTEMDAGTAYALSWADGAKAAIEAIIINYDLTLAVEQNLTVAKKILNAADYDFVGYEGEYDGVQHALVVVGADELIECEFETKGTVKDVADNATYTAIITLVDSDNYTFEGGNNTGWAVDGTSASKTAQVLITAAPLTIAVQYTKTTATFSISGFVASETEAVLTNLAYLADNANTNIEGNVYTINGYVANAIIVSATSDNTNYTISNATLSNIRKVEYVAGEYDAEKAGMTPTLPETEYLFNGFTAVEPEPVELDHYTFIQFAKVESSDPDDEFNFEESITENKVVYVIWEENSKHSLTLYYMVEGDVENKEQVGGVVYYYDDVEINYDDELPTLAVKDWFKIQNWYKDSSLETEFVDGTKLTENTVLYANYKFNIGLGDVNANGSVNANDITLYRQWIVGGYNIVAVESGKEWETVNSEAYATNKALADNNENKNAYFVKRVADGNAATAESLELGDSHLDIRDVSTIRMAMVGGYGFSIMEGKYVDGEELIVVRSITINNVSDLLIVAKSGAEAKLNNNITEENFVAVLTNCTKDVLIDLNGKTLTLKSLSISLAQDNTRKIQIKNGSIRVATGKGISLTAPNGSVILDNVTLYDEDGQFTLQAANQSLHLANAVQFLKKGTGNSEVAAAVKVEKDTHIVVEVQAAVTVEKLVVTENFIPTDSEDADIAIDNNSELTQTIQVDGNVKEYISNLSELVAAAQNGGDYKLVADIEYNGQVSFTQSATLNLNGHILNSKNHVALSASNGATLTIYGDGEVRAQEMCVMAFDGSNVVINGGTYTARDNAVFGTNGSTGRGNNTITINAGTFNGQITSAGYVACGIYVANNDTVVVNGGTFNITNGVGILARSGNTTVGADVVFNVSGNGTLGKVGDSKVTVPSGEVLVIDYAANYPGGAPTLTNNGTYKVYSLVDDVNSLVAVRNLADKIVLADDIVFSGSLSFAKDTNLNLNNHSLESTNNVALWATQGSTLTINGNGEVRAREMCAMAIDGSKLIINGGTYTAYDNAVFGTNGTAGKGNNTITINAGTFNGQITSAGYVACGIYVANNDTVVVNGGTFNITNGVGIVARAGQTTIGENVVFNVSGTETTGKVGDSRVVIPSGRVLVVDLAANYPGYNANFAFVNNTQYGVYALVDSHDDIDVVKAFANEIVLDKNITTASDIVIRTEVEFDLNGHDVVFTNGAGFSVYTNGVLTISGNGNVSTSEVCLFAADGGSIIVNGGTYTSTDNFVIGSNGSTGRGGNTFTINAGTFNGQITSAGYVACGIYVANNDTVVVNGGTFNITNGVGILARSGNTTVKADVVFNVSGNGELGKVGDSKVTVPSGEELVLDLKANYPGGVPTINNNTSHDVYVVVDGTYTFANDDASFHAARGVYDNVILTADLSDYLYVTEDMNIYLNGHTIDVSSTGYVAIYVVDGATLTINGDGNVIAREGCVMAFDGSSFVVNGGTYTCTDNFVFGTNGSTGRGNNTITINAGTFNGQITSAGYVACGIYVANNDIVVVNGGTFNITNGVGILARSGNTTVKAGVVFNVSGNGELGKVGDSRVVLPAGEVLVVDYAANYPGGEPTLTNNTAYLVYTVNN
ncbi:MAG: hypothetical protein J6T74_07980 [Clostridia bacterium]|nr:hypothetical protein [Clostridia bacterium]